MRVRGLGRRVHADVANIKSKENATDRRFCRALALIVVYVRILVCVCVSVSLSAMRRNANNKSNNSDEKRSKNKAPQTCRLCLLSLLWRTHLFIKRICSFCG